MSKCDNLFGKNVICIAKASYIVKNLIIVKKWKVQVKWQKSNVMFGMIWRDCYWAHLKFAHATKLLKRMGLYRRKNQSEPLEEASIICISIYLYILHYTIICYWSIFFIEWQQYDSLQKYCAFFFLRISFLATRLQRGVQHQGNTRKLVDGNTVLPNCNH